MQELNVAQMEKVEGGVCLEPVFSMTGVCLSPCPPVPGTFCIQ